MSTLETNIIQPATGTTLTVGASGDTITIPSGATISNSGTASGFVTGTYGTWTSTINYNTTLTATSANATTTVTANYYLMGKVYHFDFPSITRDGTFSGSDALIFSVSLPATVNSTVGGLNIISGYKVQGKYSSTDMTGDGQIYWYANPGATVAELQYLQLNSSGTGFVRLNGSGANVELRGSFIGA